jgi:hypothetical protein
VARSDHKNFLRLVVDEDTAAAKKLTKAWFLDSAPDPCPDDCSLIPGLEDYPGSLGRRDLRELIEDLASDGQLEKIQIGSRQYLTRQKRPAIHRDDDREHFRLEIELDLEREKHLLFKLLIVVEVIVIGLILRQWALDPQFVLALFS